MSDHRGTVDWALVVSNQTDPGTFIEKVQLSEVTETDTGTSPEGGSVGQYAFWYEPEGEHETSEVLLRRSMWMSMAQRALEHRETLDLIVRVNDTSNIAVAVGIVAKGTDFRPGAR